MRAAPVWFLTMAAATFGWAGLSIAALPPTGSIEQHSEGSCSPPIIHNEGHVTIICPGVAPEALHYLENQLSDHFGRLNEQLRDLNDNQRTIRNLNEHVDNLHKQADDWAHRYHELSARLGETRDDREQAKQAQELIQKGEFAKAKAILGSVAAKEEDDVARAAATQYNLGDLAMLTFNPLAALPHYEKAARYEPDNYTYTVSYGFAAYGNRNYDDAEKAFQQALKARNGFPKDSTPRVTHALVLNILSNVYVNTNRPTLAETTTSESIAHCKPLSNTDPDYLSCSGILVDASTNMGLAYIYLGRLKDAEKVLSEALPTARDLASNSFPMARLGLFQTLNNLVLVYIAEQQYTEAETTANEALTVTSSLTETRIRDASSSSIKINLGMIYTATKRFDQAEKIYNEALATRKELASHAPGAFLPDVAKILLGLSNVYNNTRRVNDASKALREAIDIYRQETVHNPSIGAELITPLLMMAELESQRGRFDDAEKALNEAENTIATVPNLDSNLRTALSQLLEERIREAQKARNGEP